MIFKNVFSVIGIIISGKINIELPRSAHLLLILNEMISIWNISLVSIKFSDLNELDVMIGFGDFLVSAVFVIGGFGVYWKIYSDSSKDMTRNKYVKSINYKRTNGYVYEIFVVIIIGILSGLTI